MTDFCMKCDNRVKGLKGFYETIKHCKSIAKIIKLNISKFLMKHVRNSHENESGSELVE